MSTEVTDEEIEKVLLEVLKKQIIDDQVAKEKRIQETGMLLTGDLVKHIHFYSKIVLTETEKRLSGENGIINNLDQRIIISFYNLFREGYLSFGTIQDEPYPPEFTPTEKGRKKLDSLNS